MTVQPPKLPQQINPRRPADTAVAPYNFVPLPEKVVTIDPNDLPDQDRYYSATTVDDKTTTEHRYTGTIRCALITETPLYVRAALTPRDYEILDTEEDRDAPYYKRVKNRPDFFYTDWTKTPVIPGSSLRGMVRSLVEMVSYSKFEGVSDQKLVYRAVGDTTSHGTNYRDKIMRKDAEGYDEDNQRYQAYTPLVKAGYVLRDQQGGWEIQPARQIGGATFARIHHNLLRSYESRLKKVEGTRNAYYIYIQSGPWDYQRIRGGLIRTRYAKTLRASDQMGSGLFQGVLARSGAIFSKRTEAIVFPLDPHADSIKIDDRLAQAYIDQLTPEQKNLLGDDGVLTLKAEQNKQDKESAKEEKKPADDGFSPRRQPIFYLVDEQGRLVFFGHTMMMRLPYKKSPLEMVPNYLRNKEQVDLSEAIFGYTKEKGEGKAKAYAGRVFFSDAHLDTQLHPTDDNVWFAEQPIVPKILSGPKATAFQQYLVQQTPSPQVIGETRDGRPKYEKVLADYTATEDETTLRGQKLYWHKGKAVTLGDIHEPAENLQKMQRERPDRHMRDSQYTQINPVCAGVHFTFDLRFENLSKVELGALLWALTLPGREGETYRHKLGMAKPYGMGAVQLIPTLQLQDRRQRYTQLFATDKDDQVLWEEGTQGASTAESGIFVRNFERHILQVIAGDDKNPAQHLHELRRMQVLFALMRWPGPNPQETRYMEIEHSDPSDKRGKVNEYRTRPVLPSPLPTAREDERAIVATPPKSAYSTTAPNQTQRKSAVAADFAAFLRGTSTDKVPEKPTATNVSSTTESLPVDRPTSPQEIKVGQYLEGTVLRVEKERIVVDLHIAGADEASLLIEQIMPPVNPAGEWTERFPNGSPIRAWVRRINQRGRVQLTMKEPK